MAGSIRALSNATTGGTVQIRLQQGNVDTTGALSIDASSGSSNPSDFGGNVLISSPGDVNISNWTINANGPNGGQITVNSNGTVQLDASGMQANATNVLTGVGGTIEIVSSSTTDFVVGSATGSNYIDGTISIAGVSGGTVSITNRQGAVLIPNFGTAIDITSGITDDGANLTLSGTRLQVDNATGGIINMSGAGVGDGGSISLLSSDPLTELVIGSATGTNFINATLQAGSGMGVGSTGVGGVITISSAAGISAIASAFDVTAAGNGGSIIINTNTSNTLTVDNAIGGLNTIVGTLTARGGSLGTSGNGGIITLNNQAGGVAVNQSNIDVSVQAANGDGGQVTLTGSQVTALGGIIANGAGTGNGGSIVITAEETLAAGAVGSGNATINGTFSANAGTAGTGGTITVDADATVVATADLSAQMGGVSTGGVVSVTSSGGTVGYNSGNVTASTSITVVGNTGLSVGATGNVDFTAGVIGAGNDPFSTNMADYETSGIANDGSITIGTTTTTANTTFTDGNTISMIAIGGDLNVISGQNIVLGDDSSLFAQGGNLIIQAVDGSLTMPDGASAQSVGRTITGGGTVVIAGQTVDAFQGGNVAVWAGPAPVGGFTTLFNTLQQQRDPNNENNLVIASGGITIDPTVTTSTPLGGLIYFNAGLKGSITITGTSVLTANGSVLAIDPVGPIFIGNVILGAVGPGLALVPVPVVPVAGGGVVAVGGGGGGGEIFIESTEPVVNRTSLVVTDTTAAQSDTKSVVANAQASLCTVVALPGGETTTDENGWVVASGYCQPFSFAGDDGSVIIGSGGTTFAPSQNHTVILRGGKMVASAGPAGLTVETAQGNINIPSDGTTIIEQDRPGVVRVANLLGGETKISMQVNGETKELRAAAGEELIVADADLSEEELIPVDGVDREPLDAGKIVGLQVKKSKFERKQMIGRDMLVNCNMGCFSITMRRTIEKLKDDIGTNSAPPKVSRSPKNGAPVKVGSGSPISPIGGKISTNPTRPTENSPIVPIAYTTGSAGAIGSVMRSLATDTAMIKETRGTKLVMEKPGVVNLKAGEALVYASRATLVRTGTSLVSVSPGTIALVSNENNIVKVRCLYDNSSHSIKLYAGNKLMTLSSGEEFIIGAPDSSLDNTLKSDPLGRRKIQRFDLNKDLSLLHTEFSLVGLMQNNTILGELLKAADQDDHAMAEKLVKMAAVITQVTARRGAYSSTGQ